MGVTTVDAAIALARLESIRRVLSGKPHLAAMLVDNMQQYAERDRVGKPCGPAGHLLSSFGDLGL
eukprot:4783322-Alexandrium_andersonii.AAC.1